MSGIDEGIPFCPKCAEEFGIIEHPSYWKARHPVGSIWFISERFAEQSPQYNGYYAVFSPSFDEKSSEEFHRIQGFECGWSGIDKKIYRGSAPHKLHYFEKGSKMFDVIFNRLMHYFNKSGGVFLK